MVIMEVEPEESQSECRRRKATLRKRKQRDTRTAEERELNNLQKKVGMLVTRYLIKAHSYYFIHIITVFYCGMLQHCGGAKTTL